MKIFIKIVNNEPHAKSGEDLVNEAEDRTAVLYFTKYALPGEFLKVDDYIIFRNR